MESSSLFDTMPFTIRCLLPWLMPACWMLVAPLRWMMVAGCTFHRVSLMVIFVGDMLACTIVCPASSRMNVAATSSVPVCAGCRLLSHLSTLLRRL